MNIDLEKELEELKKMGKELKILDFDFAVVELVGLEKFEYEGQLFFKGLYQWVPKSLVKTLLRKKFDGMPIFRIVT